MRDPHMATPRRNPAAAGSGDKENYLSQDQGGVNDCPKLWNGASSTKKKKKPGGFNLRKSIAWNPAFSIEEGVLDNVELSVLTGSQVKANWSPGSGVCGAISHSSRFGNSGSTSVLKEVAENSQGRKLPAKFRSADNKGRKLFSSSKDSERDASKQLVSTQDKRPARSIQKCIPRPPAGYSQKKVPNSSATFQMSIPKKSQSSLPVVSRIRSTASVTNISTPNKKLATVNTEQSRRVQRIPLRSKIEPTSVTKSSGPSIVKNVVPTINGTCEEANVSGKCKNISPYSQNSTSTSIGVRAASTFAKPSALRMPSPSVSFFTQGMAPVPHSDSAHQNTGSCFSGSTSSHVKPPRYKQPVNLKSNPCLTNQLPTNTSAASNHVAKPLTTECTLNTLVSSYSGIEHANVCFATQSLSKSTTYSAKSGNTNNQEMSEVACLLEGSATTVQTLSSQSNDGARNCTTSVYSDESCVHGPVNINDIGPIEDSRSLKDVCSSTKPTVGSTLSRCVSFEACNPSDLNCESKSNNCNSVAIELENSLLTGTPIAVSLSEVKSCTPDPDFLRDCDSCYQNNTLVVSSICADQLRQCCNSSDIKQALGEVHTCTPNPDLLQDFDSCNQHNTLAGSIICSDQAPQFCNSSDTKPAIAHSKSNSSDFLCNEVQPTSFQGPDTDSDMELDTDNALAVKEDLLLHVRREFDDDCQSAECSPMQPARPFHCVDEEAGAADLIDLEAVTDDSKTESHDSLTDKRQPVLSEESNAEIEFDANKLSPSEGESYVEKTKSVGKSGTNTIRKDHLKNLVPFTEEWLAVMEACGEEVLVQKTGAVQNSPTEKAAPEPSPWSPVKRKAQDVGPFDCTKYSKSVRACDTP